MDAVAITALAFMAILVVPMVCVMNDKSKKFYAKKQAEIDAREPYVSPFVQAMSFDYTAFYAKVREVEERRAEEAKAVPPYRVSAGIDMLWRVERYGRGSRYGMGMIGMFLPNESDFELYAASWYYRPLNDLRFDTKAEAEQWLKTALAQPKTATHYSETGRVKRVKEQSK